METPSRRQRLDPPEVAALRLVAASQPALASAVAMQIELLALQHRVETRLSTPWLEFDPEWVAGRVARGLPVIRFEDIPIEWTEFRLLFRKVADLLRRFDLIEEPDFGQIHQHVRSGRPDEADVAAWYGLDEGPTSTRPDPPAAAPNESIAQVLELTARPFLARAVATTAGRLDLSGWRLTRCPFCGGAPELAVRQSSDEGMLACGRCAGLWPYDTRACVHCGHEGESRLRSFASRDGVYRVVTCDACGRYFKAYDIRAGGRPLMLPVDSIATLPLDAAAQQRGYQP